MDQSLSSTELSYWMAFYSLHPFGSERDNIHAALIASTIANVNRGKSQHPFTAQDFMLKNEHQQEKEKASELISFMTRLSGKQND